jgi:hypothetical protein
VIPVMLGVFLDSKRFSLKQKMRWTFLFLVVANFTLWTWTAVVTHQLETHNPSIDWTDGAWMGKLFPLFLLFDLCVILPLMSRLRLTNFGLQCHYALANVPVLDAG